MNRKSDVKWSLRPVALAGQAPHGARADGVRVVPVAAPRGPGHEGQRRQGQHFEAQQTSLEKEKKKRRKRGRKNEDKREKWKKKKRRREKKEDKS